MAIPAIAPYPMPAASELPRNTATWQVDPTRAVLLIHDMQQYFLAPFPRRQQPHAALIENIAALKDTFAAAGAPIYYTAQPGGMSPTQRGLLADFWGPGMSADEDHRRIHPRLAPTGGAEIITKWRPSAFCRTDLLDRFHELNRDQIIITGIYAHVGLLMTAHDAFSHDIQPFLIADAIADFSKDQHLQTLRYAATRCAVVTTTNDVTTAMEHRHG